MFTHFKMVSKFTFSDVMQMPMWTLLKIMITRKILSQITLLVVIGNVIGYYIIIYYYWKRYWWLLQIKRYRYYWRTYSLAFDQMCLKPSAFDNVHRIKRARNTFVWIHCEKSKTAYLLLLTEFK